MGRKIQGKKHRGVKDPREQAVRRFESIVNKVDSPPSTIDDQEIPQKVLKLMEFKNRPVQVKMKEKAKKKGRKKLLCNLDFVPKEIELPGMTRPVKRQAIVTQQNGESYWKFYSRVNESCKQSFRESYFEDKFHVQVQRDRKTGVVTGVQRLKKTEADAIVEETKTSKTRKKKKKKVLTKFEKRELKLMAKKEMKNERETFRDFSEFKDEVKFGEVVHHPPELTVLPKRKNVNGSPVQKPGQRDLLLKTMLDGNAKKKREADAQKTKNTSEESEARKEMLEQERIRVVELYRAMKNKKSLQS